METAEKKISLTSCSDQPSGLTHRKGLGRGSSVDGDDRGRQRSLLREERRVARRVKDDVEVDRLSLVASRSGHLKLESLAVREDLGREGGSVDRRRGLDSQVRSAAVRGDGEEDESVGRGVGSSGEKDLVVRDGLEVANVDERVLLGQRRDRDRLLGFEVEQHRSNDRLDRRSDESSVVGKQDVARVAEHPVRRGEVDLELLHGEFGRARAVNVPLVEEREARDVPEEEERLSVCSELGLTDGAVLLALDASTRDVDDILELLAVQPSDEELRRLPGHGRVVPLEPGDDAGLSSEGRRVVEVGTLSENGDIPRRGVDEHETVEDASGRRRVLVILVDGDEVGVGRGEEGVGLESCVAQGRRFGRDGRGLDAVEGYAVQTTVLDRREDDLVRVGDYSEGASSILVDPGACRSTRRSAHAVEENEKAAAQRTGVPVRSKDVLAGCAVVCRRTDDDNSPTFRRS